LEIRRRFEELGVKDLASSLKLCPTASASATAREIRAGKRVNLMKVIRSISLEREKGFRGPTLSIRL